MPPAGVHLPCHKSDQSVDASTLARVACGMQAIILAAGLGSRLGSLTSNLPKAMIPVAGRVLIDWALEFCRQCGVSRRIVVSGFGRDALTEHLRGGDPDAIIVDNPDYREGNLLSLRAGQPALLPGGFLLMNTDHIYPAAIARLVGRTMAGAQEVSAFCDFDRDLGADDMKVRLDGRQRVVTMSKQLDRWDAGYVGMTFVPAAYRVSYELAVRDTAEIVGRMANVEQVLVRLAELDQLPAIVDVSGHGWYEVDEPHERAAAESALGAADWGDQAPGTTRPRQ